MATDTAQHSTVTDTVQHSTALAFAFPPPQAKAWESFCRARVAGKTQRDAWIAAYPDRADGLPFTTQRQNGSDLDRRPEIRARIAEIQAEAMADAKHDGADLVRSLATEIADARTIEDAAAVKARLDALEDDAKTAGTDGLQVRASVCMCRVKLIEVLGRIRLQALGHLTRYASRARFSGSSDAPVKVQINFGGAPDVLQVQSVQVSPAGTPMRDVEALPRAEEVPDAGE